MRQLSVNELRDRIRGCYTGKNIGGTFGAPFECLRQVNTVTFYTQDLSMGPPANDDLDLQLVWLNAVEKFGRTVDSHILGEYWLSYIIPNWVEYGMAKANLRSSLLPPLSGYIDNTYSNSCGAFIRSEIWACLAPGHPEIAAAYAYEDAIVDHCEEGAFYIFNRVVLSLMRPAFAVQMIFKFVESWNNYFIPALILNDNSKKTMPIVISLLRSSNFADYDNGLVYMVIAFSILPSVIIYLFLSRFIISGITQGGVKG